jgi:hypothetical protein
VKIRGQWRYLYRAVDRAGKTVDVRLSARRDVTAAKAFFKKAIKSQGSVPRTITLDRYAASHRAVREMKRDGLLPGDTKLRSSKYLNNLIEQDHRNIKSRINVMLGFKRFSNAAVIIAGIELMHRIRKGQFDVRSNLKVILPRFDVQQVMQLSACFQPPPEYGSQWRSEGVVGCRSPQSSPRCPVWPAPVFHSVSGKSVQPSTS